MQSSLANSSVQKNSYPLQDYPGAGKAMGIASYKSLGGAAHPSSDSSALGKWYENNIQYWREVQAGKIQVSQQEFQKLEQWFGYAEQQLGIGSSSWGNDPAPAPGISGPNAGNQGPVGNVNITDASNNTFTADGSTPVVDVWVDSTFNIPPPCTGTAEITTDNRFNPPEKVTKIIVTNPSLRDAKGNTAQTVIFVHDGCKVTANASKKDDGTSRFKDSTGTVTLGEYSAQGAGDTDSKKGKLNPTTGELEYVAEGGETFDFHPQALAKDGKPRTHNIWGDINLLPPGGYHAEVQVTKDANGKVIETTITVKDRDGKVTDIYKLEKGYDAQLNFKQEYVKFGNQAEGDSKPEGYDNVTLPGIDGKGETPSKDSKGILDGLVTSAGSEDKLVSALKAAGFTEYATIDKLRSAVENGTFPGPKIDNKMIELLKILNPDLKKLIEDSNKMMGGNASDSEKKAAFDKVISKLTGLLGALYPKEMVIQGDDINNWKGKFKIGATEYQFEIFTMGGVGISAS